MIEHNRGACTQRLFVLPYWVVESEIVNGMRRSTRSPEEG